MDFLAKASGFLNADMPLSMTADRIEKDPKARRSVIHSLIDEGYIKPNAIGENTYQVTLKAFNEEDMEPYIGELNIGSRDRPLATWLSGPMMKYAIEDLASGRAVIKHSGKNTIIVKNEDARDPREVEFDRWLSVNIGFLACELTDMSKSFSECLKLPEFSGEIVLEETLAKIMTDHNKEIERLKRTNDAIVTFANHVERIGGWGAFRHGAYKLFSESK